MSIATNTSVEANSRVNALQLATDLAYCQVQLPAKLPSIVQRQMPITLVRKIESLPELRPTSSNNNSVPLSKEEIEKQNKL